MFLDNLTRGLWTCIEVATPPALEAHNTRQRHQVEFLPGKGRVGRTCVEVVVRDSGAGQLEQPIAARHRLLCTALYGYIP